MSTRTRAKKRHTRLVAEIPATSKEEKHRQQSRARMRKLRERQAREKADLQTVVEAQNRTIARQRRRLSATCQGKASAPNVASEDGAARPRATAC